MKCLRFGTLLDKRGAYIISKLTFTDWLVLTIDFYTDSNHYAHLSTEEQTSACWCLHLMTKTLSITSHYGVKSFYIMLIFKIHWVSPSFWLVTKSTLVTRLAKSAEKTLKHGVAIMETLPTLKQVQKHQWISVKCFKNLCSNGLTERKL